MIKPRQIYQGILILICTITFSMMFSCDGKEKRSEDVSFIGPGTFGISGDNRPVDVGVLVNPNGTFQIQNNIPDHCPLVYAVNARSYLKTNTCDPQFDYSDLVTEAETMARAAAKKIKCPNHCPYLEGFPDPTGDHYIRWECITQDSSFLYYVTYAGFFVCTDKQI